MGSDTEQPPSSTSSPVDPDISHIALIGLMGVGKTTVGRIFAESIGWPFVDADEQIEKATGQTVRELWEEGGERAYRGLERRAVVDTLAARDHCVLAVPGGVVDDEPAAAAVRDGSVVTVYLRAPVTTLVDRVGEDPGHRPLLDDHPEALLNRMFLKRDAAYQHLADVIVEVDDLEPQEAAERIRDSLVGVAIRPS